MSKSNIIFKNFLYIKKNIKIKKDFQNLIKNEPQFFETLKPSYKYSYSKKKIAMQIIFKRKILILIW